MRPVLGANIRLARLFHGLSLSDLGERLGRSKQFLSRVETGVEPVSDALENALVDELGVLPEFLREVEAMPLTEEQCHFRKQLTTKVTLRQYARARGEMLKRLVGVLEVHLELPPYKIAEADPTSEEAIERGAERCRVEWGLGWGPISNITRVAENAGALADSVASNVAAMRVRFMPASCRNLVAAARHAHSRVIAQANTSSQAPLPLSSRVNELTQCQPSLRSMRTSQPSMRILSSARTSFSALATSGLAGMMCILVALRTISAGGMGGSLRQ